MTDNEPRTDGTPRESSRRFDRQRCRALASRERRRVVYLLLDGETRSVEELATVLVGWDATESGTVGDPDDRKLTLLRLIHIHLPMLEDAGLVEHDVEAKTVGRGSIDPATVEYLEEIVETEATSRP